MDSIEVAVRFTEAIMDKSKRGRSDEGLPLQYVNTFAEVLTLLKDHVGPMLDPPRHPRDMSEIFPLSHER